YLASSAYAHAWILRLIGHWKEVLFPGFVALTFGTLGAFVGWFRRGRARELAALHGGLVVLAFWASLGPDAGLYSMLYRLIPLFSLLRGPRRLGLVVALGLAVLSGLALAALLKRLPRPALAATFLAAVASIELAVPLGVTAVPPAAPAWTALPVRLGSTAVPPVEPAYRVLATLPYGALLQMPVFSYQFRFARTRYMLGSTGHWVPLADAYSDYIPQDFVEKTDTLGGFPTRESFELLEKDRVRYAVFHVDLYGWSLREPLVARLREFAPYLKQHYADERIWLYEVVGFPP